MDSRCETARKNITLASQKPVEIAPVKISSSSGAITTQLLDGDAQAILDIGAQRVECARSLLQLLNEAQAEILKEIQLTEVTDLESKKMVASHITKEPPYPSNLQGADDRFCICRNLTMGQMVSCDNPACPFLWFHLECVGLNQVPSEWFCPYCTALIRSTDRTASLTPAST
jgi:hypothetical protein